MTDIVPISVREPHSVARLSQTFSRSLTSVDLAEPLRSLDENQPVALGVEVMRRTGVSVLGVRREGSVCGWVKQDHLTTGTLGEHSHAFSRDVILDESVSIALVLGVLANADQVFIEWRGEVAGVITRRDLQKPPLRMWLFGAVTVLDANMTWAIEELHPNESWQNLISPNRLEKAVALSDERKRSGSDCRLVDCLQIADKSGILTDDAANIAALGLPSRREGERLMRAIENLRNHLAHAQELGPKHLVTATKLAAMLDSILHAEGVRRILGSRLAAPNAAPEASAP